MAKAAGPNPTQMRSYGSSMGPAPSTRQGTVRRFLGATLMSKIAGWTVATPDPRLLHDVANIWSKRRRGPYPTCGRFIDIQA